MGEPRPFGGVLQDDEAFRLWVLGEARRARDKLT